MISSCSKPEKPKVDERVGASVQQDSLDQRFPELFTGQKRQLTGKRLRLLLQYLKIKPEFLKLDKPAYTIRNKSTEQYSITEISPADIGWDYLYLFCKNSPAGRHLLQYEEYPSQKYEQPTFDLKTVNDLTLAKFKVLLCSGTGALDYSYRFYCLDDAGARIVLSLPAEGHVVGWGLLVDRTWSSENVKLASDAKNLFVDADIKAEYSEGYTYDQDPKQALLFSYTRHVHYNWNANQQRFTLDFSHSALTDSQVAGLFNDANDEFLRHNFPDLIALALQRKHLAWLHKLATQCKDSHEGKILQATLAQIKD